MSRIDADIPHFIETPATDLTEPAYLIDENDSSDALREKYRQDIEQQTAAYLAAGKKITVIHTPKITVLPRHTKPKKVA